MKDKAWIISVDMGYGHQRAAYPLRSIANERILTANSDKMISASEKKQWRNLQSFYEGISRLRSIPLIGEYIWKTYDYFQSISPIYPFRNLSRPTLGTVLLDRMIREKKFMKSLIDYVKKEDLPFVSTFFSPAIAADYYGLSKVYCVVTDTDINRMWVPKKAKKSRIIYLVPSERSKKRLIEYGVSQNNIIYTGFPLPEENLGHNFLILKKDLHERLHVLDPNKKFSPKLKETLNKDFARFNHQKTTRPLTITFAVGGAGAQKELGAQLLKSLKEKIKLHKVRINIAVGMRMEVRHFFMELIEELKLNDEIGNYINILFALDKRTYFERFNALLHTTDVLWAKPSELSFFVGLGIPFIIAPPLGKHEEYNRKWLQQLKAGIDQEDPKYADEWLFDLINQGVLAECAWNGYINAPKHGTENIKKVIFSNNISDVKLKY